MSVELEIKSFGEHIANMKSQIEKFGSEAAEGKNALANIEAKLKDVATEARLNEIKAEFQKQFDELATKAKKAEVKESKTLNELIAEKMEGRQSEIESALRTSKGSFSIELPEVKAFTLTGDQVASYSAKQAVLPSQKINFRDLVPTISTSTGLYVFYREGAQTNNIAKQSTLGNTKGENNYAMTEVKVLQDYIAGFHRFPKQMAQDLPFLSNTLPRLLRRDYFKAENSSFITTVLAAATSITPSGTDDVEQLIRAISAQKQADYNASFVVVDETQFAELLVSTYNKGYYPGAGAVNLQGTALQIAGVPVVAASWMSADTGLIIDQDYIERVEADGLRLELSYEDSDNFQKNLVTARIECRTEINLMLGASARKFDFGNVA